MVKPADLFVPDESPQLLDGDDVLREALAQLLPILTHASTSNTLIASTVAVTASIRLHNEQIVARLEVLRDFLLEQLSLQS